MRPERPRVLLATLVPFLGAWLPLAAAGATGEESLGHLSIPDTVLVNQDGEEVRFYTDLVRDRMVAMNFIFTSCTTICPPMGASFARLQKLMAEAGAPDVQLISVSVDPVTDTPARLKAWGEKFGAGPGWTLVTGTKREVDDLLKALKVFTADKWDHTPIVLLGNDARGEWTRTYGLAPPASLADAIGKMAGPASPAGSGPPPSAEDSVAADYFTDTVLVNQDGEEMRFYSDLLRDKVVVINTIFTTCTGICPVMSKTYSRLQEHLGDRVGKDVHLVSISTDPENDTPERLKEFGERFGARPGWYLLGGDKKNVDAVLSKLGQWVEYKENHQAILLVGNVPTGLWKKAFGLAGAEQIIEVVQSVLADEDPVTVSGQ